MELFDSHSHYNDERFDENRDNLIKEMYGQGITKIINVGYSVDSSKKAIEIAKKYEFIYATCGISPNDLEDVGAYCVRPGECNLPIQMPALDKIRQLAKHPKVVAIGEIGLDYYWNKDNKELQKQIFISQIKIANELALPIIIHTREAVMDTIDILKNEIECVNKGVFHCCPLNRELVKEALKLGFYISFAGPITFKNSKNAEEIIQMVPNDKILIETDSPYLSPEPFRGKTNDSRNVIYIADKIAKVKGLELEEIAKITYDNAIKLFNIVKMYHHSNET